MTSPATAPTDAERLALAQSVAKLATWEWHFASDALAWAGGSAEFFAESLSDLDTGDKWKALLHPADKGRVIEAIDRSIAEGAEFDQRFRISGKRGFVWVLARGQVYKEAGVPVRMLGVDMNITGWVNAEQASFASEMRFRATFEQAAVGIAHLGLDGRWLRANGRCCEILGYSEQELTTAMTLSDVTYPEDLDADLSNLSALLSGETQSYSREKRYVKKNREIVWANLTVSVARDQAGIPDYLIAVIEQISMQKQLESERDQLIASLEERVRERTQELERLSMTDALTGVANRRSFDQRFAAEWNHLQRTQKPLSLILIDIDHFKILNDHLGHAEGDHVLASVGELLRRVPKRPMDLVARYGGEEFVVLLPETDAAGAVRVADAIAAALDQRAYVHPASPVSPIVTVSQGIATALPARDTTRESLLMAADLAMYDAKQSGRKCIRVATEG